MKRVIIATSMPQHKMDAKKLLYWFPRILAVLYICFLSVFAFDTPLFSIGFLTHLIPSCVLIVVTIMSWRNARIGTILFLTLAGLSIWFFHTYKDVVSFLIISLPLLLIGLFFCAQRCKIIPE